MLKNLQEIMGGDVTHALVRLWADELSDAEAAAIHNRAHGDPQYREKLHGSLDVLAGMAPLGRDPETREVLREHRRMLRERRSKWRLALGMAAGILVAAGAILTVFRPWTDDSHLQRYYTRIGEQQTIQLSDGSAVTLNTGGQLIVDYSEPARRVLLGRGEAYFEVVEDPDRPFTVDLGAHAVTAIGTAFNVRRDPERYQVAVTEGEIALHEATADAPGSPGASLGAGARIEAGWVAEFDTSGKQLSAFRPESMERYVGWRKGMLSFAREPLHLVVEELNRYSRHEILIEDPSIRELHVFLTVGVDDIDTALRNLQRVLPIRVTRYYDRVVITASTGTDNHGKNEVNP